MDTIGILGAGAMGSGIAQVAAAAGHNVVLCDNLTICTFQSRQKHPGIAQNFDGA